MIKFKCYECDGSGEVSWSIAERLIRQCSDDDDHVQQSLEALVILKPCPFCQSSRTDIVRDRWGFPEGVQCLDCGINCVLVHQQPGTKQAALFMVAKKWNTRLEDSK